MNLVILSCTSQENVSLNALTLIPYKNTITLITGMIWKPISYWKDGEALSIKVVQTMVMELHYIIQTVFEMN